MILGGGIMSKIYLIYPKKKSVIAPELYGHFVEHIGGVIYDGVWVGKDSNIENQNGFRSFIIEKLKHIKTPVIRWPGGCFAEIYDWRDGIGKNRPIRYSWWTVCDEKYESNAVGTHEFVDFCRLTGAKPYFAVNVTSADVMDAFKWMDYCMSPAKTTSLSQERANNGEKEPFSIPFWGIGNENWGGGGNMRPEYYADIYRRFSTVAAKQPWDIKLIAGGADGADYNWTHKFCENTENSLRRMSGYSFHYYTHTHDHVLEYTRDDWYDVIRRGLQIEELINRHWAIISGHGMCDCAKLVIDEWGIWHQQNHCAPSNGEHLFEQQSTMREAVHAAMSLNIFNNHCDKIMMANVAQLVNNIHSLFLSYGKDCIVTPTYYVFDMYKNHQGARLIETVTECTEQTFFEGDTEYKISNINVSASEKDGKITITAANLSYDNDEKIDLEFLGKSMPDEFKVTMLTAKDCHDCNTFENPDSIIPVSCSIKGNTVTIPKASVAMLEFTV